MTSFVPERIVEKHYACMSRRGLEASFDAVGHLHEGEDEECFFSDQCRPCQQHIAEDLFPYEQVSSYDVSHECGGTTLRGTVQQCCDGGTSPTRGLEIEI